MGFYLVFGGLTVLAGLVMGVVLIRLIHALGKGSKSAWLLIFFASGLALVVVVAFWIMVAQDR